MLKYISFGLFLLFAHVASTSLLKPLPSNEPFPLPQKVNYAADPNLFYRLPNNTKPETYDVSLSTKIHVGDFEFFGSVKIGILAVLDSTNITLHQRNLTINEVQLWTTEEPPKKVPIEPHTYDNGTEFLVIPIVGKLDAGTKYTLEIKYNGTLRDDEMGFYKSSYKDDSGNQRWLATTQFEQTEARHAFPCYDEPQLKANFTIKITHDPSYNAISNMKQNGIKVNDDGTVTTSFDEIQLSSSYLIAFIVSDFKYLSNNNETFEHRTFARSNAVELTRLALEAGQKILDGIANYLQVPFTLPKMDQAAIPDFRAGAMENWGLVTYREPAFFWNDTTSTFSLRQSIYSIIAHEFGHQWFGNLVSPKWWTYIWLNEGFANYFGNLGVHVVSRKYLNFENLWFDNDSECK